MTRKGLNPAAVALFALATSPASAASWGAPVRVTGYYVYDNGYAYFTTENNQNAEGCSSTQYIVLDSTQVNFKSIWAQIIAAHTAGNTVSVHFIGCVGAYPKADAVAVPNIW